MPRNRIHNAATPSQRALRVGELVRHALAVLALLLAPAAALAEVCDKAVGESWTTADGPVWIFNPAGLPLGVALLLGPLVVLVVTKWWWLAVGGAITALIKAIAIVAFDLVPQHEVYLMQVREGCRSVPTDLMNVGALVIFAVLYCIVGYRNRLRVLQAH